MACILNENFDKSGFFCSHLIKLRELARQQRNYKSSLFHKIISNKNCSLVNEHRKSIRQLKLEKNDIRAQISVAQNPTQQNQNSINLNTIKYHVQCQENLADEIQILKESIKNLERGINNINKEIYAFNRKIVPENQHVFHVIKLRKVITSLENTVECSLSRECALSSTNMNLRECVINELHFRDGFNDAYSKLLLRLNSDRKYMTDLIEYCVEKFDYCVDEYEKSNNVLMRYKLDSKKMKHEIQGILRKIANKSELTEFLKCKSKQREWADIHPKEYRRREEFKIKRIRKLDSYNKILDKIMAYTDSKTYKNVLVNYEEQKNLYYSYFNFSNELGYTVAVLDNAISRLYSNIDLSKNNIRDNSIKYLNTNAKLEGILKEKKKRNKELALKRKKYDTNLNNLFEQIDEIFGICQCDRSSFKKFLGDNSIINLYSVREHVKKLENKCYEILRSVYIKEHKALRGSGRALLPELMVARDLPTDLNDIVLTQQCGECGEGEATFVDTTQKIIQPLTRAELKASLYEKITQPEIQYRLHSISNCRLPRSRMLAAKQNM